MGKVLGCTLAGCVRGDRHARHDRQTKAVAYVRNVTNVTKSVDIASAVNRCLIRNLDESSSGKTLLTRKMALIG